jgi:hypothetical protein
MSPDVGGLPIPNFKLYFQALAFCHILNWFRHDSADLWLSIERNMVPPIALEELVFNDII